jgi:Holliday junction resolvase RusA-like endonuclease
MIINIKPLSVNEAWKGRRFKTDKYKAYEKELMILLPKNAYIPKGEIVLNLEFGFSSKLSDFDNPVKLFVDCLQKRYGFNDRMIKSCTIDTVEVKKGCEFVRFRMTDHHNDF